MQAFDIFVAKMYIVCIQLHYFRDHKTQHITWVITVLCVVCTFFVYMCACMCRLCVGKDLQTHTYNI